MNQHPGIIGKKLGTTQYFKEDGTVIPCTVVQTAGCVVVGKRTLEKDGYSALVLGLGERKAKHTSKAVIESFKKKGQSPKRDVRELRCSAEHAASFEIGQPLEYDKLFVEGQFIDVQARSKGRGFTGVMRRHNYSGAKSSHGAHETQRHAGSIGMATTPGRVLRGHKMAGQHGNKTVSVLNLKIAKLIPEKGLILIEGGVPGSKNGLVTVRGAIKKQGGKPAK